VAALPGRNDCIVVDPGFEPDKILELLESESLTPAAFLITHGHSDHIGGNEALKNRYPDCPIVISEEDAAKLTDPMLNLSGMFGESVISPPADKLIAEGDVYEAAGFKLAVREIPGHSSGHVVFIAEELEPTLVFGGDVLFAGSVGRTDFPGGSFEQLRDGIWNKLFTLDDETLVVTGHGPATTIGQEKSDNPYVGRRAGYQDETA
jgi:glyoxylase-like metal-dependent hydrolase (beta-lactamase superfamily II)